MTDERDTRPLRGGADSFTAVVLGERPGVVCAALGRRPYRSPAGTYTHRDWQELQYRWPDERDRLLTDAAREATVGPVDVYVCPAVRHSGARARRKGDALPPLVCWADLDTDPADPALLTELRAAGAFVVRSGSHRHRHIYLPLTRPIDLATHARLNQALAARLGGDAKWSDETLLRLPGTYSWKARVPPPGQPAAREVVVAAEPYSGQRIDPDQLAALLGVDPAAAGGQSAGVLDVRLPGGELTAEPVPTPLPTVVVRALADPDTADRSRAIARVIGACVDAGLSPGQTLTVVAGYGPAQRYPTGRHMRADVARFHAKATAARHRSSGPATTPGRAPDPGDDVPARHTTERATGPAGGDTNGDAGADAAGEAPAPVGATAADHPAGSHIPPVVAVEGTAPPAHDTTELTRLVLWLSGEVKELHESLSYVVGDVDSCREVLDDIEHTFAHLRPAPDGGAASGGARPPVDAAAATGAAATGAAADPPASGDSDVADEGDPPRLDMRELVAWVGANVAALIERKAPQTGGYPNWCRQWWMHPEAIARFEAARRCWVEAVRGDGAAMVVYFEHLDSMLHQLLSEHGPFCACKGGRHVDGGVTALGQDEPDEAYFATFADPADTTTDTSAADSLPAGDRVPAVVGGAPNGSRPHDTR